MPSSARRYGLGDPFANFNVYIANRPNFSDYASLHQVNPLSTGEIDAIGENCGNGWRKVFNVYAKLVFALNEENIVALRGAKSWQSFRDQFLLQSGSNTGLLFSPPQLSEVTHNSVVHLVMGKTYANSLNLWPSLQWLDHEFAINVNNRLLVCPYFDYRQLSNIKIIRLVELIQKLNDGKVIHQ